VLDSQSVPGALPCPRAPHCRRNNVVSGNKAFGIHVAGNTGHDNPQYDGASHIVIENNTISGQGYSGSIVWQEAARDNVIKNNIISDNMQITPESRACIFTTPAVGMWSPRTSFIPRKAMETLPIRLLRTQPRAISTPIPT